MENSPVHHSTPKVESAEMDSLVSDATTVLPETATVTIKHEFISPVASNTIQEIKNVATSQPQQQHAPALMTSQAAHLLNTPSCNSNAMTPQLMPVQIVQTSSGPMQVQPFIHNGQFGIAQVAPCRPPTSGTPMHPMMQPRPPVAWGPMYYPYGVGGCRMIGPDQMRMPGPPMYCPPPEVYMMRPSYNLPAAPVHIQYNTDMQVHHPQPSVVGARLPSNMTVCQRIKLQQQLQNQLTVPPNNDKDIQKPPIDNMATSSNSQSAIATSGSKKSNSYSNDPLQQACSIANIQSSSTNTSSHLKSPDSGFGESHAEAILTSSESEVCTIT